MDEDSLACLDFAQAEALVDEPLADMFVKASSTVVSYKSTSAMCFAMRSEMRLASLVSAPRRSATQLDMQNVHVWTPLQITLQLSTTGIQVPATLSCPPHECKRSQKMSSEKTRKRSAEKNETIRLLLECLCALTANAHVWMLVRVASNDLSPT